MAVTGIMAKWLVVDSETVLKDTGLVIEDGKIVEIVPNEKLKGKEGIVDATDSMVTPSFTNTHTHMYETVAHGRPMPRLTLKPSLEKFWWPYAEDRQTMESIDILTKYACIEHMKNGITIINDILEAPKCTPGKRLISEAEILQKFGVKGVLSLESSDERFGCEMSEIGVNNLHENRDFILWLREKNITDIKGTICTHTTFSCSVPFLKYAADMARDMGEILQVHMNEGKDEGRNCEQRYGMRTAELYKEIGFWTHNTKAWANQCAYMTAHELDIMAEMNVGISTQPKSNANCSAGIAPVCDMLRRGITVGLGTDNGHGDFIDEMKFLAFMQRGVNYDNGCISAETIFNMATAGGAHGLGYNDCGTLEAGNSADFVVFDGSSNISLLPGNVVEEIIFRKSHNDVKQVYVNGELVFKDGHSTTMDDEQIYKDYKEFNLEFWKGVPSQEDLDDVTLEGKFNPPNPKEAILYGE